MRNLLKVLVCLALAALVCLALFAFVAPALAQDDECPGDVCPDEHPTPTCLSFQVTEVGLVLCLAALRVVKR